MRRLWLITAMFAATSLVGGCGSGSDHGELPPPMMTRKLPPMKPADARSDSESFLSQLEKVPAPMRRSFAARHSRGPYAIKQLGDEKVTRRYQADMAGK